MNKITINLNKGTPAPKCDAWEVTKEPDRVSIEHNGISYSLVFDKNEVYIETWEVVENDQLGALLETIKIHA